MVHQYGRIVSSHQQDSRCVGPGFVDTVGELVAVLEPTGDLAALRV
jgi:hypothetical protein